MNTKKLFYITFTEGVSFGLTYLAKGTKIDENALRVILNEYGQNKLDSLIDRYFDEEKEQGEIILYEFGMPLKVKYVSVVEID